MLATQLDQREQIHASGKVGASTRLTNLHAKSSRSDCKNATLGCLVSGGFRAMSLGQRKARFDKLTLLGDSLLSHLDKIPVLLSRLETAGVRDRIIAQFDEVDAGLHDIVSRDFLEDSPSSMRADVLLVTPSGENVSPRLRKEVVAALRK